MENIQSLPLQSETIGQVMGALARAHLKIQQPKKTIRVHMTLKSGRVVDYKYADLNDVIEAYRSILAELNCVVVQRILDLNGSSYLITGLYHESGEFIQTYLEFYQRKLGIQEFASEITYLRRYSVSCLLGIASEVDDDGAKAQEQFQEPKQNAKPSDVKSSDASPNGLPDKVQQPTGQATKTNQQKKEYTNEQILSVLDKDLVNALSKEKPLDEIQAVSQRWEKQKDFFVKKGIYDTGVEKINTAFDLAEKDESESKEGNDEP